MRLDDLRELENRLAVQLPATYRELLINYPFASDSVAAECAMPADLEALLELNPCTDFLASIGVEQPETYFCIGSDGGETTYYIDLGDGPFRVYAADIETGRFTVEAEEANAWLTALRQIDREVAADEQEMANRRWRLWKFWT